jgi:hypothetical protein
MKSTDGGRACTDSKQCQGLCLAPDGAKIGSSAEGACSKYLLDFGNLLEVHQGKVEKLNVE